MGSSSCKPKEKTTDQLCSHNLNNFPKNAIPKASIEVQSPFRTQPKEDKFPVDIKVVQVRAHIDNRPITVDEKSLAVLRYKTPHFRATATAEVPPLQDKQAFQIGWIQTCAGMKFINTYGDEGVTSWEFPEIEFSKWAMISDAEGKLYPWYGSKREVQIVQGPCPKQTLVLHMNDNFYPQVTWFIPANGYDRKTCLSHIQRKQRFFCFLVAKDLSTQKYYILKTVSWKMFIDITIDPAKPLGKRTVCIQPPDQEIPRILDTNATPLPKYALGPPNANSAQVLVWRPCQGKPEVIVPPTDTTVDLDKYLLSTYSWSQKILPET